ncbi:MAG: nucleotidyltransferase domain-containing protein [Spirochaetota bacterium]|mgnify:CR=1 FL=1
MDTDVIEKVKQYAEAVRAVMPVKMIILYGSYARGTQNRYSDIDVAVVCDKLNGDILDISFQLYKLRRPIDTDIEPILLESGDDFLRSILEYGTVVYPSAA